MEGERGFRALVLVDVVLEQRVAAAAGALVVKRHAEVVGGLGGFGGAFAIPAGYREPLLIASSDGVGTKTAVAIFRVLRPVIPTRLRSRP